MESDPGGASYNGYAYAPSSGPSMLWYSGYGFAPYWSFSPWLFYEPYSYSYNIYTPYDWKWKTGEVRLHLFFDRSREQQSFEHEFRLLRQRVRS
jgi:hypothetical protein